MAKDKKTRWLRLNTTVSTHDGRYYEVSQQQRQSQDPEEEEPQFPYRVSVHVSDHPLGDMEEVARFNARTDPEMRFIASWITDNLVKPGFIR